MINDRLIICLTIFIIITSFFIVKSANIVFSLLLLVLSFILASFVLLLLDCEYLAFMLLIVYVSAIAVLFLFVFMLLDIKFKSLLKSLIIEFLAGYIFILCLFLSTYFIKFNKLLLFFWKSFSIFEPTYFVNWKYLLNYNNKINVYSIILYNNFVLEFLIIGFILFLVLIGIVYLINSYLNLNIKLSNSIKQASLKSKFFTN